MRGLHERAPTVDRSAHTGSRYVFGPVFGNDRNRIPDVSIERTIQELATIAAMMDGDDAPRLVALHEGFKSIAGDEALKDDERSITLANEAADLLEKVVLRDVENPDEALAKIHEAIDYLQSTIDAARTGSTTEHLKPPSLLGESDSASVQRDIELLDSWVASATETVNEIEREVLSLEHETEGRPVDEVLAEIRRRIHTLKGECGVLSAHEAQALCHEAESGIDRIANSRQPFPTDEILSLLDWMRGYIELLASNPNAAAPVSSTLLRRLQLIDGGEHSPEAETAPVADTAPVATPPATNAKPPKAPAAPKAHSTPPAPQPINPDEPVDLSVESDDMLVEFLGEAKEHLGAAEAAVLELESQPEDLELINTIFRAFHTIKGVAGFLHLNAVVELAHSAEFLLDAARSGNITLHQANLDLILRANDMLSSMVTALSGGPVPRRAAVVELIGWLDRAREGETVELAKPAPKPPPAPGPVPEPADATETAPALQTDSPPQTPSADPVVAPKEAQAAPATPAPAKAPSGNSKRVDQTIKVNTGRLDSLVDMVGELVIAQQMVVQDPKVTSLDSQRTRRNLAQVGKIIRDLQEVAMSLRMVTLRSTFQKMARLVRDVSLKAGKDINFIIEGEDTELDRNVVDEIGDPLVHMVRNACDHGVEPAADRRAAGKPEAGNVTLRAFHKGGSIIIEIEDDGRGLSREKILKKAIERGIYAPDRDPTEIPDSEIFNLVFLPGFSTADKVTDISGRGVGMDVVRRNIEALRGKVEIRSVHGAGSTFMMRLPLTMAIIDGMVVRVGSQRYVIPTLAIEQSFRPTPRQLTTIVGRGEAALVRGSLLPIYRLGRLFNLGGAGDSFDETLLVVIESNNNRCCLMVDEILGQQQVVIKSLGSGVEQLRGVSGGAILGDGRVALILDVAGLFAEATR